MLASRPDRPNVPPTHLLPPRLAVFDCPRSNVASGTYGLPSPISPPPSGAHDLYPDALLAAAVVNPRMGPSALDVTLSPPLALAVLGDPFESLPPPCVDLQTPPRSSQGWRADLDDNDDGNGDFDAAGRKVPITRWLSPPEDAFLSNSGVALRLETGHPGSPAIVSSGLELVAYEGLRICLDPSESWENPPFKVEKRAEDREDTKGHARSPSLPPPCRPEPREHDSLLDLAGEEDRKPALSAPIHTQAGSRPPDNVTVRIRVRIVGALIVLC